MIARQRLGFITLHGGASSALSTRLLPLGADPAVVLQVTGSSEWPQPSSGDLAVHHLAATSVILIQSRANAQAGALIKSLP
jgi:hypothetical protein